MDHNFFAALRLGESKIHRGGWGRRPVILRGRLPQSCGTGSKVGKVQRVRRGGKSTRADHSFFAALRPARRGGSLREEIPLTPLSRACPGPSRRIGRELPHLRIGVDHNFFAALRLCENKKKESTAADGVGAQSREGAKNWELFLGAHPPRPTDRSLRE